MGRQKSRIGKPVPDAPLSQQECVFCLLAQFDCSTCKVAEFIDATRGPFSREKRHYLCTQLIEWSTFERSLRKGWKVMAEITYDELDAIIEEGIAWLNADKQEGSISSKETAGQ